MYTGDIIHGNSYGQDSFLSWWWNCQVGVLVYCKSLFTEMTLHLHTIIKILVNAYKVKS